MSHNQVIIYSNGIADFQRRYEVRRESVAEISIPVKQEHVGDVLASLNIYGDVSLHSPPSFRPANEAEGPLSLDPSNALEELVQAMCGARLRIERAGGDVTGVLAGLHNEERGEDQVRIVVPHLLLYVAEGFQKIPLRDIERFQFEDESVQAEIDKALQRQFQEIKPLSTFVDLAVSTEQESSEVVVQYAVPAAAWKMSYRLRQQSDDRWEFQGLAIVDNNTEEDWNNFIVSVVAGEPITFSTDLADSKTPRRRHVNVVNDSALGAVEIEEAMAMALPSASEAMYDSPPAARSHLKRKSRAAMAAMQVEQAEVAEVGDFCVFQAQRPVSIDAGRSAVIPMFTVALDKSKQVLHYKHANHAERPYRAIEFFNESDFSLGRGVCTVFQEGAYAGNCVVPATKPGGDCLLAHALDTGVAVRRSSQKERHSVVGLKLAKGFGRIRHHIKAETNYQLKNNHQRPFDIVLDHDHPGHMQDCRITCQLRREDGESTELKVAETLRKGVRLRFQLPPGQQLHVHILETALKWTSTRLAAASSDHVDTGWLQANIIDANGPLAEEPAIRRCLEIHQRLEVKQTEVDKATKEIVRLNARQERLRKNIQSGGHDEQTRQWKTDLGESERRIVALEDEIVPQLQAETDSILGELKEALFGLDAEWSDDA